MRRHLPAMVLCLCLMALTLSGFAIALDAYRSDTQEKFAASVNARVLALQRSLREKLLILESMHSLYAIFNGAPQPQFRSFVQPFEAELEGVQALQWVVNVNAENRTAFEDARRLDGIQNYQITERNADGLMVRAGERASYFPVYPLLPLDTGEASIGYDFSSDPVRSEALQRAIASGELAASARVNLLQEQQDGEYGFLVFAPVFRRNAVSVNDESSLAGLVVGIFRISNIVEAAQEALPPEPIVLEINDLTAQADAQFLYRNTPSSAPQEESNWSLLDTLQPADLRIGFDVAGRYWETSAAPGAGYMSDKPPVVAWTVLAAGLILTISLTTYLVRRELRAASLQMEQQKREQLENQLFRSQKLEAIGQLVGGVAHDFNNLLTSIVGYADLASFAEISKEEANGYLKIILQTSERGQGLIRKLLSFSRDEPSHCESQALAPLIENILDMLKPVMTASITIKFSAECGLPQVSVDHTGFDQMLVNLCVNARDAISGTGQIDITLRYLEATGKQCFSCNTPIDGAHVVLSVSDDGSGIDADVLAQIFKPFFTTKDEGKGTGLGLPIINNVIHGCDGHLLVESIPAKGTTFRLLFPVEELQHPAMQAAG